MSRSISAVESGVKNLLQLASSLQSSQLQ